MTMGRMWAHTTGAGIVALAITAGPLAVFAAEEAKNDSKGHAGPGFNTQEPAQLDGLDGWETRPIFTVGEYVRGYRPPGLLDGIGALQLNEQNVRVFVNHELAANRGYLYTLANGTRLTGARVSYFDINRNNRKLIDAGPAYDAIVDRAGNVVTTAQQINEGGSATNGIDRTCSGFLFEAGDYGLVDHIYFAGEETTNGQEFALDVVSRVLYCVPWMGRAAFENVTALEPGDTNTVAFLIGNDTVGAPLTLYVGTKNHFGNGSFLDRNGLAWGKLYVWKTDNGDLTPQQFHGTGSVRTGTFVQIVQYDASKAGQSGYDALGFANQSTLATGAAAAGAFQFSRPEDVTTNPANGSQAAFNSTGKGSVYPADTWGTTYLVDVTLGPSPTATVTVLYDGDDAGAGQFAGPDYGLRSPDNLDWADDGMIYINEDPATEPAGLFGATSGKEASVWKAAPATGVLTRIGIVNRSSVPSGQTDSNPGDLGNWETSGVMDVTTLFETAPGEVLLIMDVQAHSLVGTALGAPNQAGQLVEGGQLLFLTSGTMLSRSPSGVPHPDNAEESRTRLGSNTPNPFNPATTIPFALATTARATLRVYDASGGLVRILFDGVRSAGEHAVTWDGRNTAGNRVASGVYFYRLDVDGFAQTRRMVLLK